MKGRSPSKATGEGACLDRRGGRPLSPGPMRKLSGRREPIWHRAELIRRLAKGGPPLRCRWRIYYERARGEGDGTLVACRCVSGAERASYIRFAKAACVTGEEGGERDFPEKRCSILSSGAELAQH